MELYSLREAYLRSGFKSDHWCHWKKRHNKTIVYWQEYSEFDTKAGSNNQYDYLFPEKVIEMLLGKRFIPKTEKLADTMIEEFELRTSSLGQQIFNNLNPEHVNDLYKLHNEPIFHIDARKIANKEKHTIPAVLETGKPDAMQVLSQLHEMINKLIIENTLLKMENNQLKGKDKSDVEALDGISFKKAIQLLQPRKVNDILGRNRLFKMLRNGGILQWDNRPTKEYEHCFKVETVMVGPHKDREAYITLFNQVGFKRLKEMLIKSGWEINQCQ